ncbi:C40 family peptidase [Aliiroseovarius sp. S2029]|uniref:C40 family peptidase n=1 Tax=Aliiroseovarius sp. S2029 TaxID=2936988 RepID=UPI0020BFE751|nr:C40 family peptidase [Aliiroseovarius sp. S2029]MCK8483383.1 C40 family peptidase [Aliiroseovarius sp. S2029]
MDPRLTPANTRIAHDGLRGKVDAPAFTRGTWRRVATGVVDILKSADGPRNRQALMGERVLQLEDHEGFAFVQAEKDGYVGYVASAQLTDDAQATHWVCTPGTHLYPAPDMKQRELAALSFGARVTVVGTVNQYSETDTGCFVPTVHLAPVGATKDDVVANAALFLGTPYLWGGNSRAGIDCSGLVQAALLAAGHECPGDSDMQEALGHALDDTAPLERGDLLFWKGHVALVVDPTRMIHANAFHMAVAYEGINEAITRIEAQGDGPVVARRRL